MKPLDAIACCIACLIMGMAVGHWLTKPKAKRPAVAERIKHYLN